MTSQHPYSLSPKRPQTLTSLHPRVSFADQTQVLPNTSFSHYKPPIPKNLKIKDLHHSSSLTSPLKSKSKSYSSLQEQSSYIESPNKTFMTENEFWSNDQLKIVERLENTIKEKNALIYDLERENKSLKDQLDEANAHLKKILKKSNYMKERIESTNEWRLRALDANLESSKKLSEIYTTNQLLERKYKDLEKLHLNARNKMMGMDQKLKKAYKDIEDMKENYENSEFKIEANRTMKMKCLYLLKNLFSKTPPKVVLMKYMELEDWFMPTLCRIVELNNSIEILNLEGNLFTDKCLPALCDLISTTTGNLTKINLNFNKIGVDGAWEIMKAIQIRDENTRNADNKMIKKIKLSYNLIERPNELFLKAWDFLKGAREAIPHLTVKRKDLANASAMSANKVFKQFIDNFHDIREVKMLMSVLDRIIIVETNTEEISTKFQKNKWTAVKSYQSSILEKYSQDIKNMNLNGITADPVEKHNMISTLIKNDDEFVRNKFIGEHQKKVETQNTENHQELDIRRLLQKKPGFPLSAVENALKEGVDINSFDKVLDMTLLIYAASIGNLKLAQLLVRKNGNLELRNKKGEDAFLIACDNDRYDICEFLLFSGCKINSSDIKGANAIHKAVRKGKSHSICRLVEMGMSVNWVDNRSKTPLHYAAVSGNTEIGALLVQLGADLNPIDSKGRSPAALAEDKEKFHFADQLVKLGAKKLRAVNTTQEEEDKSNYFQKNLPLARVAEDVSKTLFDASKMYKELQRAQEIIDTKFQNN
ncbi:unnamed protein product [Blepharisma stoltei]|uniref:Ankyrin repeat protein n=1 Tax=Blepharisma stoltei TaxID=1481888 RepID=A0AAU9JKP7_9CILI|nr:unnamed protein product [Blepharisma stoltei]